MKFGHFNPQLFHYGYPGMGGTNREPTPPRPEPSAEEKALAKVKTALQSIRTLEVNRAETERLVEEAVAAIRGLRSGLR